MKLLTILSAILLLSGCPTPPETVSPSNTPGTNTTPPQGNVPPPPAGDASANPGPGAEAGAPNGGPDGVASGEGGDELPPEDGAVKPPPDDNGGGAMPPPSSGPESGMVIEIQDSEDTESEPAQTQEQVQAAEHVTFSGQISCDSYTGSLIMRVTKAPSGGGDAGQDTSDYLTAATLGKPGAFSLAIPKTDEMLILEILADTNGDGGPTIGERFAIYMLTGDMSPSQDRSDMSITIGI